MAFPDVIGSAGKNGIMGRLSPSSGMAVAVCLTQVVIAMLAAAFAAVRWGEPEALAALFGGGVAVVPAAYFALRVFVRRGAETPAEVVGAVFRGEIGKFALTVVMFWFGVMMFAKQFLVLLATYAACLLAYWVVLARASRYKTSKIH
jgi:ATP synthase protein I